MRIDEITIPRKLRKGIEATAQRQTSMENILKNSGWNPIGSGTFSNVYAKENSRYVLKINSVLPGPDVAYDKFAKFCKQHNSPYLPKIYDKKYFKKHFFGGYNNQGYDKEYYIYILEKLDKCPEEIRRHVQILADDIDAHGVGNLITQMSSEKIKNENADFLKDYPGLFEVLCELVFPSNTALTSHTVRKMTIDISGANIMFRKETQTPVISDPWC